MPIYLYRCLNGHEFDRLGKFDEPPPRCPACDAVTVRAMTAPSAYILKGDGFYKPSSP